MEVAVLKLINDKYGFIGNPVPYTALKVPLTPSKSSTVIVKSPGVST